MKTRVLFALLWCLIALPATAQRDSFSVFFRLDEPGLDAKARNRLDRLVYDALLTERQQLQIVGYADYLGSNGYNDTLSLRRAGAVRTYLVEELGLPAANITTWAGRGEVSRPGMTGNDGYAPDRRVDIFINRKQPPVPPLPPAGALPSAPRPSTSVRSPAVPPVRIDQLKENEVVPLPNLFFYMDRHRIKDSSLPVLQELVRVLQDHPTIEISIEGHICCFVDGPDAYDLDADNFRLSYNRAKAVYNYLVSNGVEARRLRYRGFGRSRPAVQVERTEEDAQKNRRVEIRVLKR